jgi:hypothetical protein
MDCIDRSFAIKVAWVDFGRQFREGWYTITQASRYACQVAFFRQELLASAIERNPAWEARSKVRRRTR